MYIYRYIYTHTGISYRSMAINKARGIPFAIMIQTYDYKLFWFIITLRLDFRMKEKEQPKTRKKNIFMLQ